jgi:diadenosine tetraphosphate (Ap4A) HIT family hydrolase
VTPGHHLVIPRGHQGNLFALTPGVYAQLWLVARNTAQMLGEQDESITGFTVGVNVGTDAGQTVGHVHLHLIPRRRGDVADPRGGVRWVIPDTADYWSA